MTPTDQVTSDLPDLTGIPIGDLAGLDEQQIAPALRRILRDIDNPKDAVAGFQSAI